MSKLQSKDSPAGYQETTEINLDNSVSSSEFNGSPSKGQPQTSRRKQRQSSYDKESQEDHSREIEELKQNGNHARSNVKELTSPVRWELGNYHEEKHDHLREKESAAINREKQLNKLFRDIQQKEQILQAFEEQRYLVTREYQAKYDDLIKDRKDIEDMRIQSRSQNEKYAKKLSQLENERQDVMQEKNRQESDKSMLKAICSKYGQTFNAELSNFFYTKDKADRIQDHLKQQIPSAKDMNLHIDSVNHYLSQCLQFFAKVVTQRQKAREKDYKSKLNDLEQSHQNILEGQRVKFRNQLKQMRQTLQRKYDELTQKAEKDAQKMEQQLFDQRQSNAEDLRQKMTQKQKRITFLQNFINRNREDNLKKLNQLSSKLQQKYNDFEQKAKKELDGQRIQFKKSLQALKVNNEGLRLQKLQKQKRITQLQKDLHTKTQQINQLQENVKSLKISSQKLSDFKQQHQRLQSKYLRDEAELKSDFEKKMKQMQQSLKSIKEQKDSEIIELRYHLENKHSEQKTSLNSQIRDLQKQIKKMQEKEVDYLDDIKNLKTKFQDKQKRREIYKVEFQAKTTQVIESIVKDESTENTNNRQIFSQLAQDLQSKLTQQCEDKELICRNYSKLNEKYNNLSKQHNLLSLKLQETNQSLFQVQLKEQMGMNEVTQLRRVLSQIQQRHRKVIEQMENSYEDKLSTTIEEASQFYQVILNSKEKIYEGDLTKLQQELQSINLIKKIKEKFSADNQRMLQNERQELKARIKTLQSEHNSVLKANKNEIATLTQSNQFLKKSLDLSSQTLQAKQRILQSLQAQKTLFRKTINFIHNRLDERSLEQILEELDDSQEVYNLEVVDLVNGIFFSVNGVSVQNKRLKQLNQQLTQEKENLGYILKEIEGNAEDKDKKLEKIATQSPKFQEKINSLEAELKNAKNKNQELLKRFNNSQQNARKSGEELESIRNKEKQAKKENDKLKAKLDQVTQLKSDVQRIFAEKEYRLQCEANDLKQKIDTSARERSFSSKELENSMKKEIEQLKGKLQTQAIKIIRLQQSIEDLKRDNERLLTEKSTLERTIADIKRENLQLAEANKLRAREQEPVRQLVTSPNSRDSQKFIQYEQKATLLERQNKKLESYISSMTNELKAAKADFTEAKKKITTLLDEINELKRDQEDEPTLQGRKHSWNEQEQLVQGYQQIAKDLREQNTCLQQEIESLKAKLKRYQARSIKSYISPPKENGLSDNKSPPKVTEFKPAMQIGSEKKAEEPKKKILFSTNCIMENDDQGSTFVAGKIEEIFGNKKIESTQMLFKLSQSIKTYSFSSFLSKDLLQTQCYLVIFSTKTTKFAILSYKLEGPSRQSAMLFSITNKKTISKRVGADNNMYQAVSVEIGGDFVVGGGHIRMKPSSKTLAVKDVYRYFETYDKKEIYGNEHWRDDLSIELSEFEVHRVFLK